MFKIFTEQLKEGHKEEINLVSPPDFLDLQEAEITLSSPVTVQGEAYTTDSELVLHLQASTEVVLPCSICNEPAPLSLSANEIYFTIFLYDLKSAIYDYTHVIRDELLLLIPQFTECREGRCPSRKDLEKYQKKPHANSSPFADLPLP
jgi:uncharacterized metal-binding protein YceD (DUF177 family)